ncbi:response regulator [Caulobacter sp.]|uniref:response regulator n=1 Tax=Caulobacter sp. TaxID=78 RepID=UPI001B03D15A|nr:response regulator [Caulobacter sp.]MBO9545756.1 response regulator [Caulobacter sp.]
MEQISVLLVEDNAALRAMSQAMLAAAGYRVHVAADADEALSRLDREPPAALVTDINLGAGADGFDLARRARMTDPGLPVVYVSARCAHRFPSDGVSRSEFVAKPIAPWELLQALGRALESRQ